MKKILWISVASLTILAAVILVFKIFPQSPEANQNSTPAAIKTNAADFEIIRYGTGTVEPLESIPLYFQSSGTIAEYAVTLGETVKQGQMIAVLDTENQELLYQKALLNWEKLASPSELAKTYLLISQTRLKLEAAQKNLEIVIAGPSIEYYEEQVSEAYAAYQDALDKIAKLKNPGPQLFIAADNALAEIATAEETLALAKAYVVPQEDIKRAQAEVSLLENTLLALETLTQYLTGSSLSEMSNPVISESLITLINAENDLVKTQTALEQSQLTSPIDGLITKVYSSAGASVSTNNAVAEVTAASQYQVHFYLDQSDFAYVSVGDHTRIYGSSFPDQTLSGTITRIEPALVSVDGSYKIEVWSSITPTETMTLGYGTSVEVEVIALQKEQAIFVPLQALITGEDGTYQVVVIKNGQPHYQTVTIAENDYANVIIASGLNGGEMISIDPQSFIEDES